MAGLISRPTAARSRQLIRRQGKLSALRLAGVAVLLVALMACGSNGDETLDKPLFAKCGTKGFGKGLASRGGKGAKEVWLVHYTRKQGRPERFGETTAVTIVERSLNLTAGRLRGGRDITVAGRPVRLLGSGQTSYVAQWKTPRAIYVAIANGGSPDTLKGFISCMP